MVDETLCELASHACWSLRPTTECKALLYKGKFELNDGVGSRDHTNARAHGQRSAKIQTVNLMLHYVCMHCSIIYCTRPYIRASKGRTSQRLRLHYC